MHSKDRERIFGQLDPDAARGKTQVKRLVETVAVVGIEPSDIPQEVRLKPDARLVEVIVLQQGELCREMGDGV